jgi:hypothetical protein
MTQAADGPSNHPLSRGQAAPRVVDQRDESGEQALMCQAPGRSVARRAQPLCMMLA